MRTKFDPGIFNNIKNILNHNILGHRTVQIFFSGKRMMPKFVVETGSIFSLFFARKISNANLWQKNKIGWRKHVPSSHALWNLFIHKSQRVRSEERRVGKK